MSSSGNSDDILSRWARRREAVAKEEAEEKASAQTPAEALEREPETEEEAMALLSERDPELAEKVTAVDIDALTYEDDFTVFMSKNVPEIIRRRALSKLWISDPVLANLDGLNEYDEDFKAAAELVKVVKSAWEPGRGYARDDEDEPEEEVAAADEAAEEESAASLEEAEPEDGEEETTAASDSDIDGISSKPGGQSS